jgi:hypothetical protein
MKRPSVDSVVWTTLFFVCAIVIYYAYTIPELQEDKAVTKKTHQLDTTAQPSKPNNTLYQALDKMIGALVYNGQPFILNYQVENGFCIMRVIQYYGILSAQENKSRSEIHLQQPAYGKEAL